MHFSRVLQWGSQIHNFFFLSVPSKANLIMDVRELLDKLEGRLLNEQLGNV